MNKRLEDLRFPGLDTYKLVVTRKDVVKETASFQIEFDLEIQDTE
jgi:hypothetical protein